MTEATQQHVRSLVARLDDRLRQFMDDQADLVPPRLMESIRYSLFSEGKRLRPMLVMLWHDACGGKHADDALAAAGAIELIHCFSLVHDDLPAMDDDELRRGKPTNHKVFGEAMAILAGDAMTTLAFEMIATHASSDVSPTLIQALARASGPAGMIGGQVIDIDSEHTRLSLESLQKLHAMKTGALIENACVMGAIAARANEMTLASASVYGRQLGLAFQIVDDLLDATSTTESLGKAAQKDAQAGKNTYPALMGIDASRSLSLQCVEKAIAALTMQAGPSRDALNEIARFVVERTR